MKYFKILKVDGSYTIEKAETTLALIKKFDLATRQHINTRIIELEGEQRAIAISNELE